MAEGKCNQAQRLIDAEFLGSPSEQAAYQVLGDLELTLAGQIEVRDYEPELELETAVARTSYTRGGVRPVREVFASAGTARHRGTGLVPRLEDQHEGPAAGACPRLPAPGGPAHPGAHRAQPLRPAPALPDRRQLRRRLRHHRDAGAEPSRRDRAAARPARRLAHRCLPGAAGTRRLRDRSGVDGARHHPCGSALAPRQPRTDPYPAPGTRRGRRRRSPRARTTSCPSTPTATASAGSSRSPRNSTLSPRTPTPRPPHRRKAAAVPSSGSATTRSSAPPSRLG